MNATVDALKGEYVRVLQEYLADGGEAALQRAYELGRQLLADGMAVLEIAARIALLRRCRAGGTAGLAARCGRSGSVVPRAEANPSRYRR